MARQGYTVSGNSIACTAVVTVSELTLHEHQKVNYA